jgi:hypothetical protein
VLRQAALLQCRTAGSLFLHPLSSHFDWEVIIDWEVSTSASAVIRKSTLYATTHLAYSCCEMSPVEPFAASTMHCWWSAPSLAAISDRH